MQSGNLLFSNQTKVNQVALKLVLTVNYLKIVQQQNDLGGDCYPAVGTVDLLQDCLKRFICEPR